MWVWFNQGDPRLPSQVLSRASSCAISVISIWEVLLLIERGRIESPQSASKTVAQWLERYPFREIALDREIVQLSRSLDFIHEDPADRFIAASAHHYRMPLATSDAKLRQLAWLNTIA